MILKVYIFFFFLLSGGHELLHDFHLSKTDVHYKTEQLALQLTVHTFIDDTEAALKKMEDLDYKFFESVEHAATDSIFLSYLKENLVIKIDGIQQTFEYVGKEQSDDIQGIYTYLEIGEVQAFETIEIYNALLTDTFEDQRNIINVKVDNKSKAFHILTKKDNIKHIELK